MALYCCAMLFKERWNMVQVVDMNMLCIEVNVQLDL